MLMCVQDEVEHLVDFVDLMSARHYVLQVQQVGENFEHLVPDSLGEILCVGRVDVQKGLCDVAIDLLQILSDE